MKKVALVVFSLFIVLFINGQNSNSNYILTPPPLKTPRINGAKVFGVRPNSPVLFKIAATGDKPLKYKALNLPKGLQLDEKSGIITGKLSSEKVYKIQIIVSNSLGIAKRDLTIKVGNLISLTPPLGWNSWNCWGVKVSQEKVISSAQALIDKGLIDHGWTYINIDDGWEAPARDAEGMISSNSKFPDMKGLANWLHSHGLKFGIYSSPGPLTCGGYLGSYQHELQDAQVYNSWDVDYLKYDWCAYGHMFGQLNDTSLAAYMKPYLVMQEALRQQPRDIHYSLCQYGMKDVWKWGDKVNGNSWRTTGDISASWKSLLETGFSQNKTSIYAKPGRWNDPDMLIVGNLGLGSDFRVPWGDQIKPSALTPDEQYTHISLWSLLASPLLIGCDIASMDDFTVNLLSNDEVLEINQDPLGNQASQIFASDVYQVWAKDLEDGSKAIGIFNMSEKEQNISIKWSDLKLEGGKVRDLWRQKDLGVFNSEFVTLVPTHGVSLIKIH